MNHKRGKNIIVLSPEGKGMVENKLEHTPSEMLLDGYQVYINDNQSTPIKLRDRETYLQEKDII
mgnify:CR=1 FL=1